jgi:hypothetical protein
MNSLLRIADEVCAAAKAANSISNAIELGDIGISDRRSFGVRLPGTALVVSRFSATMIVTGLLRLLILELSPPGKTTKAAPGRAHSKGCRISICKSIKVDIEQSHSTEQSRIEKEPHRARQSADSAGAGRPICATQTWLDGPPPLRQP